eukprot:GHVS01108111.1.p1 GENE.GHVS01108111.1~~GHVS01108111.1.p1  ORF type:complete len:406 (+),score=121.67 GHVS01108111.1:159-1376(+)
MPSHPPPSPPSSSSLSPTVLSVLQPKAFYRDLFSKGGKRKDGRELDQTRAMRLTPCVLETVNGSSVSVRCGRSYLLVAANCFLQPHDDREGGGGRIEVQVDFSKVGCGLDEGGGTLSGFVSTYLNSLLNSGQVVDLSKLKGSETISMGGGEGREGDGRKEGRSPVQKSVSWVIRLEAVVVEHDGAVLPLVVTGLLAALECLQLPKLVWDYEEKWWRVAEQEDEDGEEGKIMERSKLERSGENKGGKRIKEEGGRGGGAAAEGAQGRSCDGLLVTRPVAVSFARLFGSHWLVDPTKEEEALADGTVTTVWRSGDNRQGGETAEGGWWEVLCVDGGVESKEIYEDLEKKSEDARREMEGLLDDLREKAKRRRKGWTKDEEMEEEEAEDSTMQRRSREKTGAVLEEDE